MVEKLKNYKMVDWNWSKKLADHQWLLQSSTQFPAQLSKTNFCLKMRKNQMAVTKSSNQRYHDIKNLTSRWQILKKGMKHKKKADKTLCKKSERVPEAQALTRWKQEWRWEEMWLRVKFLFSHLPPLETIMKMEIKRLICAQVNIPKVRITSRWKFKITASCKFT